MTMTISILVVAVLAAIGLLIFAPVAEFRRRGLKAVLVSSAMVTALGMGTCFAAFIGLMLSGNPVLSKLSMHALMAAIAMPLVLGMAALAFGAMAATWPNVFARPNDRFATNIYVLIGVAIVVACASSSLHTDWPGYLIAVIAVPLVPAMTNRRLRRSRPAGFGAEARETFLSDRPEQAEPRFAEPVIAKRAAPSPARQVSRAARPAQRPDQPTVASKKPSSARQKSAQVAAPKTAVPKDVPSKTAPARAEVRRHRRQTRESARSVLTKLSTPAAARLMGLFRRISKALTNATASARQAKPVAAPRAAPKTNTGKALDRRTASPTANAPRRMTAAPVSVTAQARPQAKLALPKPSLLPDRVASRPVPTPPPASPALDRKKSAGYPLTAPFEPGTDRWATFIDGVLTTETGIQRKIAARSTQALEDLSGAA